jgi:hypothetical protein
LGRGEGPAGPARGGKWRAWAKVPVRARARAPARARAHEDEDVPKAAKARRFRSAMIPPPRGPAACDPGTTERTTVDPSSLPPHSFTDF